MLLQRAVELSVPWQGLFARDNGPMAIQSAGLLLYRRTALGPQVFLVHMGGPIWARKDLAAWSIPKGVMGAGEDPLVAAQREFREETGFNVTGRFEPLGTFRQNSSKNLTVWALQGDCDPANLKSNSFTLEWPPKSGSLKSFPEADRGAWLDAHAAMAKIVRGQRPILAAFFDSLTTEG
jgi:predicted NUDIX family NTP pyrophosphohydrolase